MNALDQDKLAAATHMNAVQLKVGDLPTMSAYYQNALGLEVIEESAAGIKLGRRGQGLVNLQVGHGLQIPARTEAGLFHTALLFDTRGDLAATVLSAAQYNPQSFVGSQDHLVSEAFYFTDPEGNGIELYFDRPRANWGWNGDQVEMDSLYMDPNQYLNDHLNENAVAQQRSTAAEVGHVHLQVGDLPTARKFYVDILGFDQTHNMGNQALFVSAGGYHHHMAMNVWNSRGAGPRKDTLGLGEVLINVPEAEEIGKLAERLNFAGINHHHTGAELQFKDPWNNQLRVAVKEEH